MDQNSNQDLLNDSLSVNRSISSNFLSAAKWGRFTAISLLVVLTLAAIFLAIGGSGLLDQMASVLPGIETNYASVILVAIFFIILIAGLLLFIMLRAYNHLKVALETRDMVAFTNGWRYLKIYFLIYGVFTLISIFSIIQSLTTLF